MKPIDFAGRLIGAEYAPLVIAEIGINHGGSLKTAFEMVDGAALAGVEVVKHQTHVVEDEMSQAAKRVIPGNAKESIYEKYFNPNNPTSTLVNMAVGLDGTFSRSFVSIVGEFFSSLGSIFHPSSSIFTNLLTGNQHKALAAQTSAPYNIIQWGWSADELSRIRNNPDLYSPLNLSQRLESVTPEAQKLIDDKYSPCYTKEVGELLAQGSITREDNGSIIQQPEPNREGTDCSPDTLGSTEAFEWRLHKRYNAVLDHGISIADLTPTTTSGVILNSSGVDCGALIDILNPGSAAAYDQCMGTTGAP
jgi:hypothetical protein